jgi:serine/threonine protein kinase
LVYDENTNEKYVLKTFNKLKLKTIKIHEKIYNQNDNKPVNSVTDGINLLDRELEIIKKIFHPKIVNSFEILSDKRENRVYTCMEYCEKGELCPFDEETNKYDISRF